MNKIRTASLLAILFLSFCSCGNKPYPNAMNRADSIVSEYPDSAFIILQEIGKDIYTYPQGTRMYYYLLYTKAKDKAYIPHTTDKLMQIVVQYYERKKTVSICRKPITTPAVSIVIWEMLRKH